MVMTMEGEESRKRLMGFSERLLGEHLKLWRWCRRYKVFLAWNPPSYPIAAQTVGVLSVPINVGRILLSPQLDTCDGSLETVEEKEDMNCFAELEMREAQEASW
jgi:predicted alpha/beta hydrolase